MSLDKDYTHSFFKFKNQNVLKFTD